ncbi:unnamed protein product [Cyberlindnera jadinii]|uniref:Uncharacterized protein n=1 Tax=Cyberlindnera jadinii (strain ATCC 18201 / CBS 1600 / BCRC 20928 / JCM 3617 / NBRC 0987 / NRRL Y-1542) TaxID=983966 RepID=A0A0H5BYR1_CYBJN|nr:unnamed protein product [Cyberlindnera jadinii]
MPESQPSTSFMNFHFEKKPGAASPPLGSCSRAQSHGVDPTETPTIDTNDPDDMYPPESFQSPIESPPESSLIFERSVEDPSQIYQQTTCPRCGHKSSQGGLSCTHHSIVNLPSHYSVENFVSPCLDATTQILTDQNADLENVDMVYSRRPSSVLGLNMALGRSRSYVGELPQAEVSSPSKSGPVKIHSAADLQELPERPPALSFYSYADMIESENPNPRRPSLSQSLSSSFLNSRSNSIAVGNSITPQRTPMNLRNHSFSSPFNFSKSRQGANASSTQISKKFTLNSDNSPGSSDSESDYVHSRKNSMSSRASKFSHRLKKTLSTASNLQRTDTRASNQDDVNSVISEGDSLVISSVGETIRRNTGEIRSGVVV